MRTNIQNLPVDECFPRSLRSRIESYNEKTAELQNQLRSIPAQREELAAKVYSCEISGADAVKLKRELADREVILLIDMARHLSSKGELNKPICDAYKKEAEAQRQAMEKRAADIAEKMGDVGTELIRRQAQHADGIWRQLDGEYKRLLHAGSIGILKGPDSHQDAAWINEYHQLMHSRFGPLGVNPSARQVSSASVPAGRVVEKSMWR